MSDISLIIEETADILTRNERKQQKRKESYTPKELEEMLAMQEIQKSQNRDYLNEKLVAICENATREYNLSSVPLRMMEKIAIDISFQVKKGNITSVKNIEKNEAIIKTIQKEATKAQIIENYEAEITNKKIPHEEIVLYIEEIKYIASNPKVADAIKRVFSIGPAEQKINNIANEITIENADEMADRIQKVTQSKEYKEEQNEKARANLEIFENAETSEENRIACNFIEADEARKRYQINPKDRQAAVNLMQNCLERMFSNIEPKENIASYIRTNLLSNKDLLNPEQRTELENFIEGYEQGQDQDAMIDFLANRITEFNKSVTKERVIAIAKAAADTEITQDRVDKDYLKNQGCVRMTDDNKYINYCDVVNQIFDLKDGSSILDWEKLAEVQEQSTDLYALTLRATNKKSREMQDDTIFQKTQNLINKFAIREKSISKEDAHYIEDNNSKIVNEESAYWVLAENVMSAPESFESIKKARIQHIQASQKLSEEEKKFEILQIEEAETPEELLEYALDGIEKEHIQKRKKFDREKCKKDIITKAKNTTTKDRIKSERKDQRDIYAAKAKVLLEPGEYERYVKATRSLGKGNEIYDEELLDLLQGIDSELYEHLCVEYFAKCKGNQEIINKTSIRINEIKRAKRKQLMIVNKTQEETERPAEERTALINDSQQDEGVILEAIISKVTTTNDFMKMATKDGKEKQDDEER